MCEQSGFRKCGACGAGPSQDPPHLSSPPPPARALVVVCGRAARARRDCNGAEWQTRDGESLSEGNTNASDSGAAPPEHASFAWRSGHERMTTGIWMYSEPFIHAAANGEKLAVLVVDTQGLFDNEASMLLTSCIFGLSTLMSSHSIYNVKERISEDHLQNLALFSE